ncbi:MAG: signal peptidase I [Clostridia bacterium]|nr:signal peptidase I [Clostridia bacterium]
MKFESYKTKIDIGDIIYVIVRAIMVALLGTMLTMMAFGYNFMIVTSGSMTPTLPVGSLVIVQPIEYDELNEGDIITVNRGGFNVTHRIYGKASGKHNGEWVYIPKTIDDGNGNEIPNPDYATSGYWVTKGDASDTPDKYYILEDELVGKVISCFESVGYVYRFVKYNTVYSVIILCLFMLELGVAGYIKDMVEVVDIEEDDED